MQALTASNPFPPALSFLECWRVMNSPNVEQSQTKLVSGPKPSTDMQRQLIDISRLMGSDCLTASPGGSRCCGDRCLLRQRLVLQPPLEHGQRANRVIVRYLSYVSIIPARSQSLL